MIHYDTKYVPEPRGFANTGVLCYFNSLSQCLLSCPALNQSITSSPMSESNIETEYCKLYSTATTSYELATAVSNYRNQKNYQWNISPHRQEDIHEGFVLLLEALADKYNHLFNTRYQQVIYCSACNSKDTISALACPAELTIDVEDTTIQSQEDMENYIRRRHNTPPDYRCEHCGAKNSSVYNSNNPVQQFYFIARLSSVIVLIFKENQKNILTGRGKHMQYYPQILEFQSKTEPLRYQVVARAQQFGTLSSGHYTADVLRGGNIYNINDSHVSSGSLEPTANTYMVFYHLI